MPPWRSIGRGRKSRLRETSFDLFEPNHNYTTLCPSERQRIHLLFPFLVYFFFLLRKEEGSRRSRRISRLDATSLFPLLKSTRADWINDAVDEARGRKEGRSRWRTLAIIPDIIQQRNRRASFKNPWCGFLDKKRFPDRFDRFTIAFRSIIDAYFLLSSFVRTDLASSPASSNKSLPSLEQKGDGILRVFFLHSHAHDISKSQNLI